jgi:ketohexokinase/beta-glucosidase
VQFIANYNGLRGEEGELIFMQDNTPGYATKDILIMLKALVILREKWPPFSPDLNPIETLWKYMKIYLEKKYRDYVFKLYDIQRERIWEAWHAVVTPGLLIKLIKGMPERIKAVILADGKFTKY